MPEGDRSTVIGFGVVVALLTIFALWHVSTYNKGQSEQREKAASFQAYNDQDIAACSAQPTDFEQLACLAQKITANQERERGRADLNAQQDMATWAVALLWVSGIGVVVSVAGIVLIYATLHETRAMTIATREIGEAQTRAYLMVRKSGKIRVYIQTDGLVNIHIEIPIENTGSTPAFGPSVKFRLFFFQMGPRTFRDIRPILEEKFDCLGPIAPNGGEYTLKRHLVTNKNSIDSGILSTARHRDLHSTVAYVHIELFVDGKDYAGKPLTPYEVFVESEKAFDRRSSGGTDLILGHPDLISGDAAGYGPIQDFWVNPTRSDLE